MIRDRIIQRLNELSVSDLIDDSKKDRQQYKKSFRANKIIKKDGRRKQIDLEKNKPDLNVNL